MNLLDLPPDVRAKRLARMGMTEDEYRADLSNWEKELEAFEKGELQGQPDDQVSDKFKSVPGGILNDDAIE